MELFDVIKPTALLAPYIKHYWILETAQMYAAERVIATGCVDLIFHKGERMFSLSEQDAQPQSFICGLKTDYLDIISKGRVEMIVVVFQPMGFGAFFDIPTNEFKAKCISINDIGDETLNELEHKVQDEPDYKQCVRYIEDFLLRRLYRFNNYHYHRMLAVISTINSQPEININALAETSCLSYKQFNRVFTQKIGINPKEFSRIIRFQKSLYLLQQNPRISLTQLAFDCGYYDQPHMVREFKHFSGYTPTEYLSICDPYSDYFS